MYLHTLLNILRGEMAFVGPRPLSASQAQSLSQATKMRFSVRPGWFSLYALRQKTGVAHEAESEHDKEFIYNETLKGDVGLMLRYSIGSLLGGSSPLPAPDKLNFFGVEIVNTDMMEAVQWIGQQARQPQNSLVAYVNPDCLNIAYRDEDYQQILQQAERVFPDGIGIHIGCRMLGQSLRANVNCTDLFPLLCQYCVDANLTLFLLGAQPGVAEATAQNMTKRYPGLRIAGHQHGFFAPQATELVIADINASRADILIVAFGAPQQEKWLAQHRNQLQPKVLMGVGGLFDFYAERIPRAPRWMRDIGMEWIWRLMQEPKRMWRRYIIGNPLFLYRVWRQARTTR
ncbi:WecB/TagA/CpsF family glycosyltransferase [Candidatus Halobeggiatoa sp. HSG11]|nr:WecB/TagA/CpsF family glycosyltransferase [Candidatus Halobeggiatoa sp. HSG11]